MVVRSNLLLDFNAKAGPPIPSVSRNRRTNNSGGPPRWGRAGVVLDFSRSDKPTDTDVIEKPLQASFVDFECLRFG